MFGETKNENSIVSPVEVYLEWKKEKNSGKTGFVMYDKELETEVLIDVKKFIVIDEAYQIRGYNKKLGVYLKSNIVNNKKEEKLIVTHDGKELYNNIYDPDVKPQWASLYRILTVNNEGILTRLILKPSVSKEFVFAFVKSFDDDGKPVEWEEYNKRYSNRMTITGTETKESNFGDYIVPKFKIGKELTPSDTKETTDMANSYREYLDNVIKEKNDEEKSLEGSK